MSDVGRRWSEVGERIEALALKLKLHFEQAGRPEEATDPLRRIRDSLTRFDERLAMREERYQRQFAALESALSRSQALSNQLAAQLNSLMSTSNR